MAQKDTWEKEYRTPQLLALGDEPQKDVRRFLKFLRRKEKVPLDGLRVLDLGSGTGKNAQYLAELGNTVIGLEISETAVALARKRAGEDRVHVDYRVFDIGSPLPFADGSFDLVLDVMTSNSLNERERTTYLTETARVLRQGGHFFVRTLCKDGDKNAQTLLKTNPGPEHDTYILPGMNLVERIFTEKDFRSLYEPHFSIMDLSKKTNYVRMNDRNYKRNYWLAVMRKD